MRKVYVMHEADGAYFGVLEVCKTFKKAKKELDKYIKDCTKEDKYNIEITEKDNFAYAMIRDKDNFLERYVEITEHKLR